MPGRRHCLILPSRKLARETTMTGGSALYLLMCLGTFGAFTWVLHRVSSQQDRAAEKASPQPVSDPGKTA
jgi:hypothetical protein